MLVERQGPGRFECGMPEKLLRPGHSRVSDRRINNRDKQHAFRDVMKRIMSKEALRYSDLIRAS
jgi:hypothetical protein